MAKCEFCDKGVVFGIKVSHSHRRSNRPWKPNVKRVKAIVNGTPKHVYVCTRCLRSGEIVFKADLLLRLLDGIVHWTILLLRNLQALGNESEHCAPPTSLNFSETFPSMLPADFPVR